MNSIKLAYLKSKGYVFDDGYERIAALSDQAQKNSILSNEMRTTQFLSQVLLVYKLIEPIEIHNNLTAIKNIFYSALNVNGRGCSFFLSPISGWINYKNYPLLYNKRVFGKQLTNNELKRVVENFVKNVSLEYSKYSTQNSKFSLPSYFQHKIVFSNITPNYIKKNVINHWIVQYNFVIPLSENGNIKDVVVRDSMLEFVIDSNALINSLLIRWRPLQNEAIPTNLLLPAAKKIIPADNFFDFIISNYFLDESQNDSSELDSGQTPTIEYKLDGDNSYQTHLFPYLMISTDDETENVALVKHTLNIVFSKKKSKTEVRIEAEISGGSEDYQYSWVGWEIAHPENFMNLGSKHYCIVLGGSFQILLTVKDIKLNTVTQFQEFIFANNLETAQFPQKKSFFNYGCIDPKAINYDRNANTDDGSCKYEPDVDI